MSNNNGDMPANPCGDTFVYDKAFESATKVVCGGKGLTKREHFAALAMQGLLSCDVKDSVEVFARTSVEIADALLAALENKS